MWSAIALAFGLAMDATAVSAARGLGAGRSRENWVACGLLVAIGGKMLLEAWRGVDDDAPRGPATLLLALGLALATSIDAAAAGLTLPLVPVAPWISLTLIGVVTAACSAAGYLVGGVAGKHLGSKLEVLGGLVLIGIGVQFLVRAL